MGGSESKPQKTPIKIIGTEIAHYLQVVEIIDYNLFIAREVKKIRNILSDGTKGWWHHSPLTNFMRVTYENGAYHIHDGQGNKILNKYKTICFDDKTLMIYKARYPLINIKLSKKIKFADNEPKK